MDRDLIAAKLEQLRYCLNRLREKCPEDPDRLQKDPDLQDIIAMNLARAVQISVDIALHLLSERGEVPSTMGEAFERLAESGLLDNSLAERMRHAVGFRNIAVHAYDKIDWHLVTRICKERLVDFEEFGRAVYRLAFEQSS